MNFLKLFLLLVLPYIIPFINLQHQESCFKYSITKPSLKKGIRNNMTNYRPTPLLTSFSKALENITCGRLLHHINTNNILVNEQFGFWTKPSTEKASLQLLNEILNAWNNKLVVGGIFCSCKKPLTASIMMFYCLSWSFME